MRAIVGVAALAAVPITGIAAITYLAVVHRPAGNPREFVRKGGRGGDDDRTLVVCAGDSLTHASLSADYVAMLREGLDEAGFEFVNAGRNGSTSRDLLRRVDDIVACRPDAVTILIGSNDALQQVGHSDFRANLEAILAELRTRTSARIAVLSVPPLGEDLSTDLNRTLAEGSGIIRQAAAAYGAVYLPLNEIMTELIEDQALHRTDPADPRPFRPTIRMSLGSAFGHYVCRRSWDEVADRHGLFLLIDQIHLSDRGATVIADLVADWLTSRYGPSRRAAVRY